MHEEIIREFMSKGKLLSPDALSLIASGKNVADHEGVVVTVNDINSEAKGYSIIKNMSPKKKEFTVDDVAAQYRGKYEKIRDIIAARLQKNFISLNKLDNYRNEVFVTGVVNDIRKKEDKTIIELEDTTGIAPVIFDNEMPLVELDDVIAVRAVSARNILFGKQVLFPDVALRQPSLGAGRICVAANLFLNEAPPSDAERFFSWLALQDVRYVFIAGNIGDAAEFESYVTRYCTDKTFFVIPGEKDTKDAYPQEALKFESQKIISLSNPAMVDAGGLKILLIHKFDTTMLKKRYLGSKVIDDYLVLDETPDIVCFGHSSEPYVSNYKSITSACSGTLLGSFKPVIIDLATREAVMANIN